MSPLQTIGWLALAAAALIWVWTGMWQVFVSALVVMLILSIVAQHGEREVDS